MAYTDPLYLNPGDLRHTITFYQANDGLTDQLGQPLDADWTPLTSTPARCYLRTLRDTEVTQSETISQQTTHAAKMWWMPGVTTDMRALIDGTRWYQIYGIDNVLELNRVLNITLIAINEGA